MGSAHVPISRTVSSLRRGIRLSRKISVGCPATNWPKATLGKSLFEPASSSVRGGSACPSWLRPLPTAVQWLTQAPESEVMALTSASVWPVAGHLTFLSLSFLLSKRGTVSPTLWEPCNQVFSDGCYHWAVPKLKRAVNENALFKRKVFFPRKEPSQTPSFYK